MSDNVSDPTQGDGPVLRRSIGTTQLALYALGSMVGSGIYGLIGKLPARPGLRSGCRLSSRSAPLC